MWSDTLFEKRKRKREELLGMGSELSDNVYMFFLGLFVVGGLLGSAVMAGLTYDWEVANIWVYLAIGLVLPIIGIIVSFASNNWQISLMGYALVFLPLGAILGPFVALYELNVVVQVIIMTMIVSTVLWIVATFIPPITQNWYGYIIGLLLILIAGDLTRAFMPSFGIQPVALEWWAWVGAILFSGLIIYDVNKAMQRPKTLDNAVDSSVGIYLDIINLFIRLLEIYAKAKGSSSYKRK
jgi:FtsH-binding integral membrane protein